MLYIIIIIKYYREAVTRNLLFVLSIFSHCRGVVMPFCNRPKGRKDLSCEKRSGTRESPFAYEIVGTKDRHISLTLIPNSRFHDFFQRTRL